MKKEKRYSIMNCGRVTRCEYQGYTTMSKDGEYIVLKNLEGGKDFRLNKYFWNGCKIVDDVIHIL